MVVNLVETQMININFTHSEETNKTTKRTFTLRHTMIYRKKIKRTLGSIIDGGFGIMIIHK